MVLTQNEKIELAEDEVKQAETMVDYTRVQANKWVSTLELRRENLERIKRESLQFLPKKKSK